MRIYSSREHSLLNLREPPGQSADGEHGRHASPDPYAHSYDAGSLVFVHAPVDGSVKSPEDRSRESRRET